MTARRPTSPFRAGFVIAAVGAVLHVPFWGIGILLIVYFVCETIDGWWIDRARRKAIEKVIDYELIDWEPDPDDPTVEVKGALARERLTGESQALFRRMATLLKLLHSIPPED